MTPSEASLLGDLVGEQDSAVERVFGTRPEPRFDRVNRMAAGYFGTPVAFIAIVREDRVWFKSRWGFDREEAPLAGTLVEATLERGLLVLEDVRDHPQWAAQTIGPYGELRFWAARVLMGAGGEKLGVFAIAAPESRRFEDAARLDLGLVATWVEDELARSSEEERAATVQRALLPKRRPDLPGYSVAGACVPARDVGGDFFDWHATHDGLSITLADVMGKGVGAAIIAASVRAVLRAADKGRSVSAAVSDAAAVLDDDLQGTGTFVTVFHARLRAVDGSVRFVDAGHGLALVVRGDGEVLRLATADFPLGATLGDRWQSVEVFLEPGDVLVAFSDGLLDLGDGTLDATLHHVGETAAALGDPDAIVAALTAWARARKDIDDVTVVAIRRDAA